jgi:diguanylate cyclase (GGDEF)-like protein
MDGDFHGTPIIPLQEVLDRLMPMHLLLDQMGNVLSHGPTLGQTLAGQAIEGENLWDVFDVRGPGGSGTGRNLLDFAARKLRVLPRNMQNPYRLRGLLLPLQSNAAQREKPEQLDPAQPTRRAAWILNLSFGIDLPRAVAQLTLTDADFAVTDLAMEMLYLAEANVSVTGEMRALAERLEGARVQAREEALTDTLTGLRNRRAFDSVLARLCREGAQFGLMHMDLDYFKAVNDTLGHAAGDHVLIQVASVLKARARGQDCIARVGGDEFVLLLPGITSPTIMAGIADRVIQLLSQPIPFNGNLCRISASFGYLLVAEGEGKGPATALAEADLALYAAKKAGRGRALIYDPAMAVEAEDPAVTTKPDA